MSNKSILHIFDQCYKYVDYGSFVPINERIY